MSKVHVYNEWDPIEEIIVGDISFARWPVHDRGFDVMNADVIREGAGVYHPVLPDRVIDETREDLEILSDALRKAGIVVQRPRPKEFSGRVATPYWQSDTFFCYCPRDVLLTVGDTIIETPSPFRSRYFEAHSYGEILHEYLLSGSKWLAAPKPKLLDELYDDSAGARVRLRNTEIVFDAANCLRAGRDILYLVADSGNELGARWLQTILGDSYRVHCCPNLNSSIHIDSTIALLRPGLALLNPARIDRSNLPAPLGGWDILWAPEMKEYTYSECRPMSTPWLGMNLLMVSPTLAMVDSHQTTLIRELERHRIDALPISLRHGRTLGGGVHCVTLDVRRSGGLEDYFS